MQSNDLRIREILGLKSRAISTIVENYSNIFQDREFLLDHVPKALRKEIFARLVHRGILANALFARIIDKNTDILDLKSVAGLDDQSCQILRSFPNIRRLFLAEIAATSEALSGMFSQMYRLTALEINNSPTVDDNVLKAIAENCPCIRVLNVTRTSVGDEGLYSLAENSITLIALDISHTKVSFAGIERLISSPCGQTLKELKCRGSKIAGREEILSSILGFKKLEDYSFTFHSNEDADWVLSRLTTRLKNFAFNIPL